LTTTFTTSTSTTIVPQPTFSIVAKSGPFNGQHIKWFYNGYASYIGFSSSFNDAALFYIDPDTGNLVYLADSYIAYVFKQDPTVAVRFAPASIVAADSTVIPITCSIAPDGALNCLGPSGRNTGFTEDIYLYLYTPSGRGADPQVNILAAPI
jgi:hypothetical protein